MESNDVILYQKPDAAAMTSEAESTLACARGIKITSPAMLDLAAEELKEVSRRIISLEEKQKSIISPILVSVENIRGLFREPLTMLKNATQTLKLGILAYHAEQEKLRVAEQARLDALAASEKARLKAEADAITKADEDRRKEDELAKQKRAAELEAKQKQEALELADKMKKANSTTDLDAAQRDIIELEKKHAEENVMAEHDARVLDDQSNQAQQGVAAEVAALTMTALVTTAAVSDKGAHKAAGVGLRGTWKGRCNDPVALIHFIGKHPEYAGLLTVNSAALNAMAKAQNGNMRVDGCEAYFEKTVSVRTK